MAIKYPNAQRRKPKFQSPGHYTDKDREKIPDEDFAGPARSFPIVTQSDVADAARLIGHAADPDAVKARIIGIAKRKGFSLPESWQEEASQRADVPEVVSMPFAKVLRIDEKNRLVTLRATTEATDTFRTAFAYEASKEAFQRWEQEAGNIREMHAPKAVGRSVQVDYDDRNRAIDVTLRISKGAQDTWEKIVDGTLQGGSIGASNVVWQVNQQRAIGAPEKIATKYDLIELSLVDNPSNPDCRVLAVRAAHITDILDTLEETPMSTPTPTDSPVAGQPHRSNAANYYRARMSDAQRVAAAGERAENEYRTTHPQQQHEQTSEFIARTKAARGSAEANELVAIATEKRAAEAQYQASVAPPAPAVATPETTRDAAPAPAAPMAGVTTATGYQPHEMDGAVEIHAAHEHRHRHSDGTVHSHPHLHDHGTAHRAVESDDAPHAEHAHVYQQGKVTDLRLTQTEETRAPASQMGSGATMPKPTTGTASVFDTSKPANPVKHTKAQMVGHRVDYNTEDASAKDFGVPDPEDDRETPGDNEEELTMPPDMFHEGGEWPEHGTAAGGTLTGGTYDFDGDHDGGSDHPIVASRPPAPTMRDPAKNRPTPGNRAAEADETRIGARVSADSQDTLHGIEDQGLGQIIKMCEHCGCDTCSNRVKAIMLILNPAEGNEDEDMDGDEDEMRMSLAAVTRQQNAMLTTMQRLASANEQIVTYLQSQEDTGKRLTAIEARLSRPQETRMQAVQSQQLEGITRAAVDTYQLVKELASSVGEVAERVVRIEAMPVGHVPAAAPLAEIKRLAMDRNANAAATNDERVKVLTDFSRDYAAQHPNDANTQAIQMAAFEAVFRATQGQR
jgi:phage head maturation protease